MSINKVILVGFAGKDPEVRHLEGGRTVANFTLATDESYTPKGGEKVKKTEWHNIVMWDRQAEFAEMWLRKGCQICVDGKLATREYEDKGGNNRRVTEIVGNTLTMITWPKEDPSEPPPPKKQPQNASDVHNNDLPEPDGLDGAQDAEGDDLPFL